MRIQRWMSKHLKWEQWWTKALFLAAIIYLMTVHIVYFSSTKRVVWPQLLSQLSLFISVSFWIHSAPKFTKHIRGMRYYFDGPTYEETYKKYMLINNLFSVNIRDCAKIQPSGREIEITEEDGWFNICLIPCLSKHKRTNRTSYSAPANYKLSRDEFWLAIIKLLYIALWIMLSKILVCLYINAGLITLSCTSTPTLILLVVSLILNCESSYCCIAFTRFTRLLSVNGRYDNLRYNHYLPSQSKGIQSMLNLSKYYSTAFLFVLLIYTCSFIFTSYPILQDPRGIPDPQIELLRICGFIIAFVGFGMYVVISLGPKYFLRRITDVWKSRSLHRMESDLFYPMDLETSTQTLNNIRILNSDKINYISSAGELALTATSIVLNIVSVMSLMDMF